MKRGVLALLGSGETAPGMTKVHRALLERLEHPRLVNLDTAYGFQENVPQMTEKLVNYFETSLHVDLEPVSFTSYDASSPLERTIVKQRVREATYVFAGPGSPSYALAQWLPLELTGDLEAVLAAGGTLCFSSAAVATLGAFSPPIYEIYKVGLAPYWNDGLDLMAAVGLNCVVIPHFDNNEGGNYDTSRCYLGERRLSLLEERLPEGVATLGVDEHTALIFDLANDTVEVQGRSRGHWRLGDSTRVLENATITPLSELRDDLDGHVLAARVAVDAPLAVTTTIDDPARLAQQVLDGGPDALEALAQLVRRSETGGDGHIDPTLLVEGVLKARRDARASGAYALADELRDVLVHAGIDVQDAPGGSTWSIRSTP